MRRIATAAMFCLVLVSCNHDPPTDGMVLAKVHHESRLVNRPIVVVVNRSVIATPRWVTEPEWWELTIRSSGEHHSVAVSKDQWESLQVGDIWYQEPATAPRGQEE